jgi:hypothetical protein
MKPQFFGPDASHEEVTDSIADVGTIILTAEEALEDGWQWEQDPFKLFQVNDEITDLVKSGPQFIEEFKELNPTTALTAVKEARQRVIDNENGGQPLPTVTNKFFNILELSAETVAFGVNTFKAGKALAIRWAAEVGVKVEEGTDSEKA